MICWNNQLINWLIGKFTRLNHWCHLLNVRASFTIIGHDKADLVSHCLDCPSGRCPPAQASSDVALWYDGKLPDLCYQRNETLLLVLSADTVSVDDDLLTNLITENSSPQRKRGVKPDKAVFFRAVRYRTDTYFRIYFVDTLLSYDMINFGLGRVETGWDGLIRAGTGWNGLGRPRIRLRHLVNALG